MNVPLEHDYIASSMERSSESSNLSTETQANNVLNLKATELRLGLPGFGKDLEENDSKIGSFKSFTPGSKRGFSDVNVDGGRNWGFNTGSEADLNPRGAVNACLDSNRIRQSIPPPVTKHAEEKKKSPVTNENRNGSTPPPAKAQVVGWPPIRSFRKNTMTTNSSKNDNMEKSGRGGCLFVKVSMDGAPYLRKVDLKNYPNYAQLSKALENLFSCFTLGECDSNGRNESNLKDLLHGSEYVLTYEDKDGDWMLVGDVPWEMFIETCKRLRIMKGSEAIGLAPRSMEKCKNTK